MNMFWEFFTFELSSASRASRPISTFWSGSPSTFSTSPAKASARSEAPTAKCCSTGPMPISLTISASASSASSSSPRSSAPPSCAISSATSSRSSSPNRSRNSPISAAAGPVRSSPPCSHSRGLLFGEFLGTFAPWADHARIAPNHLSWYLQPFFSIVVFQIFFLGSLFFLVAALSRKIFIVYLQGAAIFMLYLIGITIFSATRSLEHFWSGILDPVGFLYNDAITRYWTVVERNTLLYSWSLHSANGVFLYNRLLWGSVGLLSLVALWKLFPMSVEALTTQSSGKRAALARAQELDAVTARRSLVAAKLSHGAPSVRLRNHVRAIRSRSRACASRISCAKSRSGES